MDFEEMNLVDIMEEIIDYRGKTPKKLGGEWAENGIRALSAKNIKTGKIVQEETIRFVDKELYKKWMKQEVERGTILITSEAPFGEILYWNSDEKIVLSQRIFGLKIKSIYNSQYIYYYMTTKKFKSELSARATGSTVTGLRQPELLKCKIKTPEKKYQDKIVKILSNIDAKVQLNNHINDNLQKLILSIFNKFLVDNSNYNETTIKDAVKKIGTGADAIQRAPIVKYDTGIRCIRVGDMTNLRTKYQWGFTEMTEKDFENYKLNIGDIVVTRTAVNGLSYLIEEDMKVVCNNGLIRMSVNNKYNPLYIYLYLKTKDFYDYVHRIDGETSVRPNMKVDFFTSYKILEIPTEKQNEICNQLLPLRKKQQSIIVENERLANLRDTILPKLMNGEIELDKIEI